MFVRLDRPVELPGERAKSIVVPKVLKIRVARNSLRLAGLVKNGTRSCLRSRDEPIRNALDIRSNTACQIKNTELKGDELTQNCVHELA
jgi:hypothetical protein